MNIIQGDCREKLKELPDESVDCIVTSPPYWGLRDYGTAQWKGGNPDCNHTINDGTIDPKKGTMVERPDRSSDRTKCIKCGAKRIDSQLGLENKITDYVNNLADVFDECKRVLKKTGTAWLNIGDSYSATRWSDTPSTTGISQSYSDIVLQKETNLPDKNLCLIPFRVALELQQRGWYVRSDIIWNKPNPMPESVRDRPTKSHEHIFLLSKSKNYHYDADAIREPLAQSSIPRLNQDIKTKIRFGGNKYGDSKDKHHQTKSGNYYVNTGLRNKRDVWTITTKPYKEAHFATFPKDLIEPCIKAGCPKDGVVLDPFAGSGTVGEVAKELQKDFILIELNPEYIKLIEDRLHKLL